MLYLFCCAFPALFAGYMIICIWMHEWSWCKHHGRICTVCQTQSLAVVQMQTHACIVIIPVSVVNDEHSLPRLHVMKWPAPMMDTCMCKSCCGCLGHGVMITLSIWIWICTNKRVMIWKWEQRSKKQKKLKEWTVEKVITTKGRSSPLWKYIPNVH